MGIGDEQSRWDEGGGWSIINYEIARMERVEQNTTIGFNVMNRYGIKEFELFRC